MLHVNETIDLQGAVVIPGLHDAHIHTGEFARSLNQIDVNAATSLEDALTRIGDYAATLEPGQWVLGGRWDHNRWPTRQQPTRQDLDRVTGDRPAALESVDAHTAWLNTAALRAIGVDRHTPDPAGGRIVRDADGDATGILREGACSLLLTAPGIGDHTDLASLLQKAQALLLSVGLTSITDIDGEPVRTAFHAMRAAGELAIRVTKAVRHEDLPLALAARRRTGEGDDWLSTGPLKLFSDGALGSHTCHMSHAYGPDPDNVGMATLSAEQLAALSAQAVGAGLSVATHAIGDAAAHAVIDAYERLGPVPAHLRLRIEHAQHLQHADAARMARLGIVASMQPTHCTSDFDLVDSLLHDRDLLSYGWRTLLDAGVPLAFGSDAPVESPNPFFALHAAITRQRDDGTPPGGWQPHERLSITEALSAHTLGAAYADGTEDRKGSLEVGKLADFVAVDTDLFDDELLREEPVKVRWARPMATVVGGRLRA